MDEYIDQIIAEIKIPMPIQSVKRNILDEPIPETVKRCLLKPMLPGKPQPFRSPRSRKERKRKADFEDPHPIQRAYQDYQKDILD